MKPATV